MPDLFICSLGVPLCSPLRSLHRHGRDTRTYTYVMCTGRSASGLRIVQAGLHPPRSSSEAMHPLCGENKTLVAIRIAARLIIWLASSFLFFYIKTYLYFCREKNCKIISSWRICISFIEAKFSEVSWRINFANLLSVRKIDRRVSIVTNKYRDRFRLRSIEITKSRKIFQFKFPISVVRLSQSGKVTNLVIS